MNKTAHILYVNYLSPDGEKLTVGGIQTYITNLSEVLKEIGYKVKIYQRSSRRFQRSINNNEIFGIPGSSPRAKSIGQELFSECRKHIDKDNDILIFGSDDYICNTDSIPFIAIQHGITWDIPQNWNKAYGLLKKFYRGCLVINRVEKSSLLICVDNNFINWYRAFVAKPAVKMINIPNFAEIAPEYEKPKDEIIRIIFARRFFPYRGTRIFAEAAKRLIQEFNNIEITFAGEGPDSKWLKEQFENYSNVKFITYSSEDSLKVHSDKDIAVVPTLGSEGTSLSLLEAMSCQCAVVCTNVGGMTDIVLNGYNGFIVIPDVDSIYQSLRNLIENSAVRKMLASNGYQIVRECFSKEKWVSRWRAVLEKYITDNAKNY